MRGPPRAPRVHDHVRQPREQFGHRQQPTTASGPSRSRSRAPRPVLAELAGPDAPQRFEVGSTTEALPQIVRQRPHVEAARTGHAKRPGRRSYLDQLQLAHRHLHRLDLDVLAQPRQHIRRRAADLLGREGRRYLPVGAGELAQRAHAALLGDRGRGGPAERPARRLVRPPALPRRRWLSRAEPHRGDVFLLVGWEELRQPRRPADHQRQHAGGERVERPGVADSGNADGAPDPRDDVV